MTALSAARSTVRQGIEAVISGLSVPAKASTKCIQGGIAVLSAGFAAPGTAALGLIALGIFEDTADNTSGADGAINARVRRGTFKLANSTAGDAIAQANVGGPCFIVDDQTVALTDALGTRSYAGSVIQVDSDGVWVELGAVLEASGAQSPYPVGTLVLPVDLASLINAQTIQTVLGYAGRIRAAQFIVSKPATTAAKAATLTRQIGATPVTGGAIALTSANCTPQGANVAAAAITALNTFTKTQAVGVVVSGVTTFIEGEGAVVLQLG